MVPFIFLSPLFKKRSFLQATFFFFKRRMWPALLKKGLALQVKTSKACFYLQSQAFF
jgi:hypothetical protein